MKHAVSTRSFANPKRGRSHFPHAFGAHMNILFIIKVKIFVLVKMVMYVLAPSYVDYRAHNDSSCFEHVVQSFINMCLVQYLFSKPCLPPAYDLNTYVSN